MFDLAQLETATSIVHRDMGPTPVYAWPLLRDETGVDIWVKHENHTPTGAFKVRGGLVFFDGLKRRMPDCPGVVSATRGNHGQSFAYAGRKHGIPVTIFVPHGNSSEKNAAMRGFGAELIEYGSDFDEACAGAAAHAAETGKYFAPSFHVDLVRGVSTYALELFRTLKEIDAVYVPIGLGSGICGLIMARDLLGLSTKIVGVVSENASAYAHSLKAGHVVETNSANTFADGMAVRVPNPDALEVIRKGAERIVTVSDNEVAEAIRIYYRTTHNLAEGAGAAPLAALMQERQTMNGKRAAVILCGQNIDTAWFKTILDGATPVA